MQARDKKYYVVEFRFPLAIQEASSPDDAALQARRICEKEYGFFPSNWFTRVFEYGDKEKGIGVVGEYFANPTGTTFREVSQNIGKHEEIIANAEKEND